MVEEYTGPVDKSEFGLRRGDGPKQYVRDNVTGELRIVAVRVRPDEGINELMRGLNQDDLRGPKTGISRFAQSQGGWKIQGAPGAGDREESYPERDTGHEDDYSNDQMGANHRGDEQYEPSFDIDILMQDEPDYRASGGEPHEEGDMVDTDATPRGRPAQQDVTDFDDLVSMDVFEELERGYGGNQDDLPRATTRQGPSPGDRNPPRTMPRTYRRKKESSVLDDIEDLFGED